MSPLWQHRQVVFVGQTGFSASADDWIGAGHVNEIVCGKSVVQRNESNA